MCTTAAEYRMKFGKDVIVDIVGYRRYAVRLKLLVYEALSY